MKIYIARDKDGDLYLYDYKPCKNKISGRFTCSIKSNGEWSEEYKLNNQLFPQITFENSPQKVELKLIEKEMKQEEKENSIVVDIEHKQLKVHSLRFDKTQLVINDEYELNKNETFVCSFSGFLTEAIRSFEYE